MTTEIAVPRLDEIAATICGIKRAAVFDVGKLLLEAKALLPHGEFLPWVSAHTGISASSAENAMNAAAAVAINPIFGNLPRPLVRAGRTDSLGSSRFHDLGRSWCAAPQVTIRS